MSEDMGEAWEALTNRAEKAEKQRDAALAVVRKLVSEVDDLKEWCYALPACLSEARALLKEGRT